MGKTGNQSPKPKAAKTKGGTQVSTLGPAAGWGIAVAGAGILGAVLWKRARANKRLLPNTIQNTDNVPLSSATKSAIKKLYIREIDTLAIGKKDIPLVLFRSKAVQTNAVMDTKSGEFKAAITSNSPAFNVFMKSVAADTEIKLLLMSENASVEDLYKRLAPAKDGYSYVLIRGGTGDDTFMSANNAEDFDTIVKLIAEK